MKNKSNISSYMIENIQLLCSIAVLSFVTHYFSSYDTLIECASNTIIHISQWKFVDKDTSILVLLISLSLVYELSFYLFISWFLSIIFIFRLFPHIDIAATCFCLPSLHIEFLIMFSLAIVFSLLYCKEVEKLAYPKSIAYGQTS